ncbi:hypothetical protein BDV59DRAFT_174518 [Aspergillus ambiguus]|uniref:uncharacterized protein n=1 Tax=Aspergillus ambiguus TaxID=176160 RepID=UPI003CCCB4E3
MSSFLNLQNKFPEPTHTSMGSFHYRPWSRDGFEIAIICALPRETNAVLCAMDEVWHDCRHYYGKSAGDDNSYDFGRIGLHCVVIVTLPNMGLVKASSASRSLKMSFSSIRLALLVGICGAVPFKKDGSEILLGDVIISETIVELDYGRQYSGGFQRKEALLDVHGRPNEEILGLLQRWKIPTISETLRQGSIGHLNCLLQRSDIEYPGASQDTLFQPDYIHKHRGNCIQCSDTGGSVCQYALTASCRDLECEESKTVPRRRLEEAIKSGRSNPDPYIHIGSIGTGNSVMKSAQHRDQLAYAEGIIGFEMEGVGVWDKFNCLVIKGVCDYADSHKSKIWQDYAAVVAAAVAKEVLGQYVTAQKLPQLTIPNAAAGHYIGSPFSAPDPTISQSSHHIYNSTPRYLLDSAFKGSVDPFERGSSNIDAQKRIIASLRFPQMQERMQQIEEAHEQTYKWILRAQTEEAQRWDDLVTWLSSSTEIRRIYWIFGKPGSGKSTLMRFLAERLDVQEHMLPWAKGCAVMRAAYFSWSPGNVLQKSLEGLLRSLLLQILEQKLDMIPEAIDAARWSAVQTSSIKLPDWSNTELLHSLHKCTLTLQKHSINVLFFVDGLDEFECTEEVRQELIQIFTRLACAENVKIFLSSRPWNIFQDSFRDAPKVRLEDLTRDDISLYVRAKFLDSPRFKYLFRCDQETAEALVLAIANKAEGVFLWIRLVVRDLLKGLRDGDGIHTLHQKLEETPADLNDYFNRLFASIDPQYNREASIMLQVALHKEHDPPTPLPLRLLDLSFTDEPSPDFALLDPLKCRKISMDDREGLKFRLDSTVRRLNSRCMGLLECTYHPDTSSDLFGEKATGKYEERSHRSLYQGLKFEPSLYPEVFDGPNLLRSFMLKVHFMHRCCRDFILSPHIQRLLHQYTEGPYDARMFIFNSRLLQFLALQSVGRGDNISMWIVSYLINTLALPEWRQSALSVEAAEILQPVVEAFFSSCDRTSWDFGWYINVMQFTWHEEKSTFLTLAIDFDMRSYCMSYLTKDQVQAKKGRPILDYILRPRFEGLQKHFPIGNSVPSVDLLHQALDCGADPNSLCHGVSVWALFLSSLTDLLQTGFQRASIINSKEAYVMVLRMMIDKGAALVLPRSWMLAKGPWSLVRYFNGLRYPQSDRWLDDLPTVEQAVTPTSEPCYAVTDILQTFRIHLGPDIDDVIALAKAKMNDNPHLYLTSP